MKEVETRCLLDFHRCALRAVFSDIPDADIGAAPEIVHVLLLRCKQLFEPLVHYAIHGPLGTGAEFFGRGRLRHMIDHELGEIDRKAGLGLDCEGDLAKILVKGNFVGVRAQGV